MAPPAQPLSPEIIVKEWVRPGDILWFAVGVAMIAATVWVQVNVPTGDLVPVGNDSAYPQYVDTHRSPLLVPPLLVLAIVLVKFGSQLASPLAARLDQGGIKLFADIRFGLRMKVGAPKAEAPWDAIKRSAGRIRRRAQSGEAPRDHAVERPGSEYPAAQTLPARQPAGGGFVGADIAG
jgi:hypothetical protein